MKQRIYIDTSVFGGNFDEEFAEHTIPLFDRLKNDEFILLFSTITQDELTTAPENVRELVKNIKIDSTEFLETTNEAGTTPRTKATRPRGSLAPCSHCTAMRRSCGRRWPPSTAPTRRAVSSKRR